jgi:hypothetical protein
LVVVTAIQMARVSFDAALPPRFKIAIVVERGASSLPASVEHDRMI